MVAGALSRYPVRQAYVNATEPYWISSSIQVDQTFINHENQVDWRLGRDFLGIDVSQK
jgi:hypothetical protein